MVFRIFLLLTLITPCALAQNGAGDPLPPYPVSAEIYDRNGDGIADSIRITYSGTFTETNLPNKLQIIWHPKDTISYGLSKGNSSGIYTNEGIPRDINPNYWRPYIKKGEAQDTIVIASNRTSQFTTEVKTSNQNIGETVISWSTYAIPGLPTSVTSLFSCPIADKIPPIITFAQYEEAEDKDRIYIELSEPVEKAGGIASFAYKLQSKGPEATFEPLSETEIPTWSQNDSSVVLTYASQNSPLPGDSVRLLDKLGSDPASHPFRDLAGNHPNPNEAGRKIEGKERFIVNKNLIANVYTTEAEEKLKEAMEQRFGGLLSNKFPQEHPITLLPIPASWRGEHLQDSIKINYPNTLGTIFWPDPKYIIQDAEAKLGSPIPRSKITFTANSTYHTSLGNSVTKNANITIACENQIFQTDGATDCADLNHGLYLAWNLKDKKGRWAGTGVYVQIYNFQWEIKDIGVINKYPKEGNKAEKFGVRRITPKKWDLTIM